ncbi:glycosyltransferase 87 family protein [Microbacterium sp. DT81.1]|uniref:glycosyltransferase 87 family protein n=1 Tax=Microbacterium sp. DT81.1 TaxID=3393413 RepID=UPI003CE69181
MSRRVVLWAAFLLVHLGVAVLGWVQANQPMGDVYFLYEPWSTRALNDGGIVGITEPWVYPPLALLPMALAHGLSWIHGYTVGWAVFVTACSAAAFGLLVGRGRSSGRTVAAWFWLAFLALLGPIGMYRIDAVTVPLAVAGLLWLAKAPWAGSVLLAIGAWMKIWPAALILAGLLALRRRAVVLGGAAIVSGAVLAGVVLAGGASHALGFVTAQTGRGLQLEAPVSMFYLWRAVADIPGSFIFYNRDLLTFQVAGPQVDVVIAAMTPLLVVAVMAVAVVGGVKARRGAPFVTLFPPLSLALVLTLIVVNKVGSPQFESWLIAPLVLWLVVDRRRGWPLAATGLAIAALTQAVYPLAYHRVLAAEPFAVALLTARNLLLVVLLVWSITRLVRVSAPRRLRRGAFPGRVPTPDAAADVT